jgi:hypothetical protein
MTRRDILAAAFVTLTCAAPAGAQGNGHGHAYGHTKGAGPSAPVAAQVETTSGAVVAVRNFGSWLDDASLLTAGEGSVSLSFGYWRTSAFREVDLPVMDSAIGITRRVQVGFSVPFYNASEPGGPIARGVGDMYLNSKIQLRNPATAGNHLGFAVVPLIELMSATPPDGSGRVNWALPLTAEWQHGRWRTFGAGGYFSRGAVFISGAFEAALSERAWVTGTISRSHSTSEHIDPGTGLSATRTDVSGGLAAAVTRSVSVFGSIGRTMSRTDPDAASLMVSGGLSVSFEAWRPAPPPRGR